MKQASTRVVVRLFVLFAVHVSYFALSAQAQDLFMRRSNSLGHWTAYMTNNGALFTQSDIFSLTVTPGGALWHNGGSVSDTVIYGAGLWIGGLRRRNGVLMPHTEYSYNPNDGHSIFVPGSIIYDGGPIDSSQQARDKYRLYRSTDLVGPAWPLRIVNGQPAYIDSVPLRTTAGPPSTLGDEDLFTIYKDSDPTAIYDTLVDPFSLEVRSRISFWDHGLLKDVAIVQNEIIYTGEDTVFNPVVAMVVDGDINYPGDDRTKGVQNEGIQATVFFTDQSSTDPLLGAMVLEAQHGP